MQSKQQKRQEAQERDDARDLRTDAEQLAKLEREGHGQCREAQRLRDRIGA